MTFPRMMFAIILGFILIATSSEIWDFANNKESNLWIYFIFIFSFPIIYLLFECYKATQRTINNWKYVWRIVPVLILGLFWSLFYSYIFTYVGFFGSGVWNWYIGIFYASFAFAIGIIVQLLWEEKNVTEPL